jgi:hypothetical protein
MIKVLDQRYNKDKNRLCFPFRNSAAVSGLFSFRIPTGVIFSVKRKSGSSEVVKKLSAVV